MFVFLVSFWAATLNQNTVRAALGAVVCLVLLGLGVVTFMLVQYYSIAATLPDIDDLAGKASQFETTRIFDRNGNLLYEILDPTAGRRTYVYLEDISPFMVAATIATGIVTPDQGGRASTTDVVRNILLKVRENGRDAGQKA